MSMQYLVERLQKDDTIEKVWFNESGGWTLNADPKHKDERTREDVLDYWDDLTEEQKSDLYGVPSTVVEEENEPNEKVKLLEEENELLLQEIADLKKSYEEISTANQTLREISLNDAKSVEGLQKQILALQKKIKSKDQTTE